jgi:exodeoxyribonuclease VII small subunit
MPNKPVNLKESLNSLNEIVQWFESQEEIDVEAGLDKVKKGAELVKVCKQRLTEIENEFKQIQRDVESDSKNESVVGREENSDDHPF